MDSQRGIANRDQPLLLTFCVEPTSPRADPQPKHGRDLSRCRAIRPRFADRPADRATMCSAQPGPIAPHRGASASETIFLPLVDRRPRTPGRFDSRGGLLPSHPSVLA